MYTSVRSTAPSRFANAFVVALVMIPVLRPLVGDSTTTHPVAATILFYWSIASASNLVSSHEDCEVFKTPAISVMRTFRRIAISCFHTMPQPSSFFISTVSS